MSIRSDPAASLRWRSRISKEAVNQDDSSVSLEKGKGGVGLGTVEEYGLGGSSSRAGLRPPTHWWSRVFMILAAVTSGCSLYVLEIDMSWFTAVTSSLNIFLSLLLVYAVRRLRSLGHLRQQVQYSRKRVQSLTKQNERLYRQLNHLDGMQSRLESVRHEISQLIGQNDMTRMVKVVQRWRVMQQELNKVLQQQLQQEIIKAVLTTDQDHNFELSAPELERLIIRLKAMPGIQLNESAFRRQLDMEDDRSIHAIMRLLRRILRDASEDVEAGTTSNSSSIVALNARALCEASRRDARVIQQLS